MARQNSVEQGDVWAEMLQWMLCSTMWNALVMPAVVLHSESSSFRNTA